MGSMPPKMPSDIGRDVASELGLPWRVGELRAKAAEAHQAAKRRVASLGLASKEANGLVHRLTYKDVKEAGEGMEPLPPDQEKPTPDWAVLWREQASLANRRGAGHPSKGRSLMEGVSQRGNKKVSAYKIERWRERAKHLSFEQFAADKKYDGEEQRQAAFIEYWATIRDTVAFETHLRAHGPSEK
jgi:hypothetical protein